MELSVNLRGPWRVLDIAKTNPATTRHINISWEHSAQDVRFGGPRDDGIGVSEPDWQDGDADQTGQTRQTGQAKPLPPRLSPRRGLLQATGRRQASLPRRLARRGLRALLALTSLAVLVTSVWGWTLYVYADSRIDRVPLRGLGQRPEAEHGVVTYLLVGTDSRAAGGADGDVPGQRSDTTILAHLGRDGTTTMISFPRDMLVTIPEHTDADGTVHPPRQDKFNAAIALGGESLLVKLVENLTGIRVNHYVSVDMQGFRELTEAIGGVEVCILQSDARPQRYQDDQGRWRVSTNTNDPMSGFVGGPGVIQISGEQALAFVRQRHGLPDGDLDRIRRQQQFIGAVFNKITSSGVLTDPVALERLISAAAGALTLDTNTGITDLRALASRMRGAAEGSIRMIAVPTHAPTRAEGAVNDRGEIMLNGQRTSVQIYRPKDLHDIVAPLGGRAAGYTPPEQIGPVTVPPEQVRVAVYNGSTRSGLAASVTARLTELGFDALNAGNARSLTHTDTQVVYGPGQEEAARTVQAAVPGASRRADPGVNGIQLILGSSFTEVTAPELTAPGTPAAGGPAAGDTAPENTAGAGPSEGSAPTAGTNGAGGPSGTNEQPSANGPSTADAAGSAGSTGATGATGGTGGAGDTGAAGGEPAGPSAAPPPPSCTY